jgi:hypothetical protein
LSFFKTVRMEFQANAQRSGHGLPRMVVRRVADTAAGKHDIAGGHCAFESSSQARPVVTQVFDPGQAQAALAEQFGDLREVLVLAFSGKNLVADDDGAKAAAHARSPTMVTMAPRRERRRASSP